MRLAEIQEAMRSYAAGFDAGALTGTEALLRLRSAAAIKNIAATLEALCAARLAETEIHRGSGDRSAADLLARETGTTIGAARDAIEIGKRLEDQPLLNEAARAGEVSAQKAWAISGAAGADPSAERELLQKSRAGASLNELRDEANRIKANSLPDREARRRKIHAERFLRSWTDADGAGNLRFRDNPEVVAKVMARIEEETDRVFCEHRRDGVRERREAYAADALVAVVCGTAAPAKSDGRAKVIFRIDWAAWLRGYPVGDEAMELIGHGPVAASTIDEAIEAGGFVAAVITKGQKLTGWPTWAEHPPPNSSPRWSGCIPPARPWAVRRWRASSATIASTGPIPASRCSTGWTGSVRTTTTSRPARTGCWWPGGANAPSWRRRTRGTRGVGRARRETRRGVTARRRRGGR